MNLAANTRSTVALRPILAHRYGPDRRAAAVAIYVGASLAALMAYFLLGRELGPVAFVLAAGVSLCAILVGTRINQPASVRPWRWLAAGQAAFLLGDLIRLGASFGGSAEVAALSDVGYLGYPLIALGLASFIRVRRPHYHLARLVDGAAVGIVAALVLSTRYLELARPDTLDFASLASSLVGPLFDALLLGAAAYLVFAGNGLRGRAQQLLLLGLVFLASADVIYGLNADKATAWHSIQDTLWMASYALLGLTALVPSMRRLTDGHTEAPERGAGRAVMTLVAAAMLLTFFDVADKLSNGVGEAWFEVAEVALIALVFVRARDVARFDAARERRLAELLANASDALAVVGQNGHITIANPAAARLVGVTTDDAVGRTIFEFFDRVHPEEREDMRGRLLHVLASPGAMDRAQVRLDDGAGGFRSLEVTASNRMADLAVGGVVLNFRDVTDQVRAHATLARLGTAIEQASEVVIIADARARIEYVNPAFERVTGYTATEVIGQNPRLLQSGDQEASFYTAMWDTLTSGRPWVADFVNRRKDGSTYIAEAVISPIRDADGRITGHVGVSRDVTDERSQGERAAQLARQRALIGETLRAIDSGKSADEIARAICTQIARLPEVATAALVFFERDGGATPYGLALSNGESVPLRRLPKRRASQVRQRALKGPWIEAWEDRPWHPYNRLLTGLGVRTVAYAPVRDGGEMIGYLLVSTAAPNSEEVLSTTLPALVEFADVAGTLLATKVAERTKASFDRTSAEAIIAQHAFYPVYQALHDIVAERIVGYEALTRFEDGTPPDVRFAEAQEVGVGERLELAAVKAAIEGATAMPRGMWLNINASPALLLDGGGLQRLVNASERDIVLEITEHSEITDYPSFRRAVQDLGPRVRLAVDDAGAGFASLRHIIELRPAFVKLDRQVIAGIDQDEARQAMVAGLRHFAQNTSCWLIAEGVETAAEVRTLRDLGVRYVQGYLLGHPLPQSSFEDDPASSRTE